MASSRTTSSRSACSQHDHSPRGGVNQPTRTNRTNRGSLSPPRTLFQVLVAIHRASTDRRDLVQTTARTWITHPPTHCPNGQPLGPGEVLVGRVRHLNTGRVEVWAEMAYRECRRSRERPASFRCVHGHAAVVCREDVRPTR